MRLGSRCWPIARAILLGLLLAILTLLNVCSLAAATAWAFAGLNEGPASLSGPSRGLDIEASYGVVWAGSFLLGMAITGAVLAVVVYSNRRNTRMHIIGRCALYLGFLALVSIPAAVVSFLVYLFIGLSYLL